MLADDSVRKQGACDTRWVAPRRTLRVSAKRAHWGAGTPLFSRQVFQPVYDLSLAARRLVRWNERLSTLILRLLPSQWSR